MRSSLCLTYQAMAQRGYDKIHISQKSVFEQKFKPCLTCEVGKQVSQGKGDDSDVEALKQNHIPPGGKIENQEKYILRICNRCGYTGPETAFHIAGSHGYINICRKCVAKARNENKHFAEERKQVIGPQAVVIDFADYPEILEQIAADAKRNFRTLQNEILYRLVNHGNL